MKRRQSLLVSKDDYPGFQPKTTRIKHFCPECNIKTIPAFFGQKAYCVPPHSSLSTQSVLEVSKLGSHQVRRRTDGCGPLDHCGSGC